MHTSIMDIRAPISMPMSVPISMPMSVSASKLALSDMARPPQQVASPPVKQIKRDDPNWKPAKCDDAELDGEEFMEEAEEEDAEEEGEDEREEKNKPAKPQADVIM